MSLLRVAFSLVFLAFASLAVAAPQDTPTGAQPAPAPSGAPPAEPFAEPITLPENILMVKPGSATWDVAFGAIKDSLKAVAAALDKQGIKPIGPAVVNYTSTDDLGFQFEAGYPIAEAPKTPPGGDITVGKSRTGKALRFTHRGPYDAMESTYETITNYLDQKNLDAADVFIEEYETDPLTTPENNLVIHVLVPLQ